MEQISLYFDIMRTYTTKKGNEATKDNPSRQPSTAEFEGIGHGKTADSRGDLVKFFR